MGPREDSAVDVVQARDHKVRPSSRSSTEAIAASVCVRQPTITEVEGSHVIMISQPDAVTDVILTALKSVTSGPTFPRYGRRP